MCVDSPISQIYAHLNHHLTGSDIYSYGYALGHVARASAQSMDMDPHEHHRLEQLFDIYEHLVALMSPSHGPFTLQVPQYTVEGPTTPAAFLNRCITDWHGLSIKPSWESSKPHLTLTQTDAPQASRRKRLQGQRGQPLLQSHRRLISLPKDLITQEYCNPEHLLLLFNFLKLTLERVRNEGYDVPQAAFPPNMPYLQSAQVVSQMGEWSRAMGLAEATLRSMGTSMEMGGMLPSAKYDEGKRLIEDARQSLLSSAQTLDERHRLDRLWPLHSGNRYLTLEPCH